MKKLGFVFLSIISFYSFGQVGNENVSFSVGTFFVRGSKTTNKENAIDGKPYVDGAQFRKVTIKGYSSDVQKLRYNAYVDEMEFQKESELYYANKIYNIKVEFPELKKTYQCLQYFYDDKMNFGYLVVLIENPKFSLYKRERVELLKGEKSPNAYTKDANDYYAKEKDLYLVSNKNQFTKFPKNLNDASEIFSIKKSELESFVKTNKLNINKEEGMVKLVEFINQH